MSMSSSMSNAVSGLAAAARSAEVISSNVANANTEGYGRRSIALGADQVGGGVRVVGVTRASNDAAIGDRRLAEAALGGSSVALDFYTRMETTIGLPGDPAALSSSVSTLEANLIASSGSPDNSAFLASVLSSASQVTDNINAISDEIKNARQAADAAIGSQVRQINTSLENVNNLNLEIRRQYSTGGDVSGLIDQRQQQIDKIAEFIPLKEVARDHNQIALMTPTGETLVDGRAATLVFQTQPIITPDMTLASGALSGLTIEGSTTSVGTPYQAIAGGALAANFELRDELAVTAQNEIDAVARNLIERFSGPGADATLSAGQAGLFTDGGANFDPLNEEGVSSRISISAIVDPNQGGDVSKLRDGLGSTVSGPIGENSILLSLKAALTDPMPVAGGLFSGVSSFSGLTTEFLSNISATRQNSETNQAFQVSRATALKDIELQGGVSTDDELQKLLLVEQAYAANARVIQTVDEMLQSLLRI